MQLLAKHEYHQDTVPGTFVALGTSAVLWFTATGRWQRNDASATWYGLCRGIRRSGTVDSPGVQEEAKQDNRRTQDLQQR